eukprot:363097-Chlamydomonas_euryale.AAC.3
MENGSVYKLQIGPKAFIVVSDPVVARHLLRVRRTPCFCTLGSDAHGQMEKLSLCKWTPGCCGRAQQLKTACVSHIWPPPHKTFEPEKSKR